ncbi:MAG: hypothetical protein H6759_02680 [Candidatus Nomurabacteria bacterium]|nr:MAG: hypothetical protein H6759_02680 [Candidatus Nomurabacteria bacterium]
MIVQQLAYFYELLDGVMANEAIDPAQVYNRMRAEQAKWGEYRLRLSLASKYSVK